LFYNNIFDFLIMHGKRLPRLIQAGQQHIQ
jgi:hypothetical protein